MLVCSVSLQRRRTVAGIVAETAAALDTVNTLGIGQLVGESASAGAIVDARLIAIAAIAEAAGAADTVSATAPSLATGVMAESANADTSLDASILPGIALPPVSVALFETALVSSTATSILLGTEVFDSGPVTVFAGTIVDQTQRAVVEMATANSSQDASIAAGAVPWAFDLFRQGRT